MEMYLQIYKYLVNTLLERHTSRSVQEVHTAVKKDDEATALDVLGRKGT